MNRFWLLFLFAFSLYPFEIETDIEGEGAEEMIELIERLREEPLDVNTAKKEELTLIPFITEEIADEIIRVRKEKGGFPDKESLSKVIPPLIYERIEPYIVVVPIRVRIPVPLIRPRIRLRSRVENRYPRDEATPGHPLGIYNRILVDYGRFSMAILKEKDEGERDLLNFLALGVAARDVGPLKEVIVGYYGLDFGEGLVLSSPVLTFKGSPYSLRRKGIHLYTITGENIYKRGIACRLKRVGPLDISLFYSNATLDVGADGSVLYTYSAEHTFTGWEERKDRVREIIYGGNIDISRNLGIRYYHAVNYDRLRIRSYSPIGVNFRIPGDRFKLFGEVAYSRCLATVVGIKFSGDRFRSDIIYRYLPTTFFSPHSSPFTERRISSYGVLNDRGIYASIAFSPFPKTEITMYGDHIEWEDDDLPGRGYEYRIILNRRIVRGFDLLAGYRYKKKNYDYARFVRIQFDLEPIRQVQLRLRTEWGMENDNLRGELVYGDIVIEPLSRLSINYRRIIFDSELKRFSFTQFERDLPGVMGNRFISGRGRRDYLLVRYRPFRFLQFSIKYEETFKKSSKLSGQVDLDLRG